MGNIDFKQPAVVLERLIRGLNPWPSAYTKLDGKMLKIWKAEVLPQEELSKEKRQEQPGCVVTVAKDGLGILTGDGVLFIRELQLEGKRKMTTEEFLRGFQVEEGTILGR